MSASGNIYIFDEIAIFDRWVAGEQNEQAKLSVSYSLFLILAVHS
jgi:hypothetical protein